MICSRCNHENHPDAKFCNSCGSQMSISQSNISEVSSGSTKMCDNGHIMDPSWDICPYCPTSSNTAIPSSQATGVKKTVLDATGIGKIKPVHTGVKTVSGISAVAIGSATPPFGKSQTPVQNAAPRPTIDESLIRKQAYQQTPLKPTKPVGRKTVLFKEKKSPIVGWLVIMDGQRKGEDFKIRDGKNTIGSSTGNEICIEDDYSSGKHASLRYANQKYTITDLDSSNGTLVNDKEIVKADLNDNDIISIGEISLKFKGLFITTQSKKNSDE
jgi:hypothetical protein